MRKPLSKALLQEIKASEAQKDVKMEGEGAGEGEKDKDKDASAKEKPEGRDWKRNGV